MPRRAHLTGPFIGLALASCLSACGGPAEVESFEPQPGTADQCEALTEAVPDTLAEEIRNESAGADQSVSWGDPAIVLRCGVEKPAALKRTSQCITVDEVDWLQEDVDEGERFTTVGREFYVDVTVPPDSDAPAEVLVGLAAPVTDHDPSVKPCV